MTPLETIIRQHIDDLGPIRLDRFMELCLTHPEHGYYRHRQAIGGNAVSENRGDFITAPEISQMFGEMIAIWVISTWQAMGTPSRLALLEFGPGRGTLMADMLSVLQHSPLANALELYVVDTSANRWKHKLSDHNITVLNQFEELDTDAPLVVIGNEFFDALPVRQFIRIGDEQDVQWTETHVYANDQGLGLCQTISPLPQQLIENDSEKLEVIEYCAAANFIIRSIGAVLRKNTGAALFLDYGYMHFPDQSTLQAVRDHRHVDPLSQPGETDLTTLVDFRMLRDAARATGCQVSDITEQGNFLRALGIDQRSADLAKANPNRAQEIGQQLHRLTADDEMGALFKAISFWHLAKQ